MTSNKVIKSLFVLCITAILWVALCGCEDLGAYEDTEEYYSSFGDVVLIGGTTRDEDEYSVSKYFYNEESREDFLAGEDGAYKGVEHSDYVYMAIPFKSTIDMDSLALFLMSHEDVTVYINFYVTDEIPSEWRSIQDNEVKDETDGTESDGSAEEGDTSESGSDEETEEKTYDDPDPATRVGEIAVSLKKEVWNSFVLDVFTVDGQRQNSIQIQDGQYLLLQIRNNSGVRIFDEEKQIYLDPQTGLELPKAEFTVTNLLIRALDRVKTDNDEQGGE